MIFRVADMHKTVGSYDAKTRLPELLRRVEQGESITITKHGKPVADLVPTGSAPEGDIQSVIEGIFALRKSVAMSDSTLDQRRKEGRK